SRIWSRPCVSRRQEWNLQSMSSRNGSHPSNGGIPGGQEERPEGPRDLPVFELFAIRYATRDAKRGEHFIGGDPHDADMPMDYFVWVAKAPHRVVVIDTGFGREVAAKRGRTFL